MSERLDIHHYPDYADPAKRTNDVPLPLHGLSSGTFYQEYMYANTADHSYSGDELNPDDPVTLEQVMMNPIHS